MFNKKGDAGDFLVLLPVLLIIGVSIVGAIYFWGVFNDKFQNMTIAGEKEGLNETLDKVTTKLNMLDPMFAFFFFGFFIAILVSIAYLDTSPWFLLLTTGMLFFTILIGFMISDAFTEFIEHATFTTTITSVPITYHIMSNLPYYLLGMAFIFVIVLYGLKGRAN